MQFASCGCKKVAKWSEPTRESEVRTAAKRSEWMWRLLYRIALVLQQWKEEQQ